MADQRTVALERALARVVELEAELEAAERRARNANESRLRAQQATTAAADRAQQAEQALERNRATAPTVLAVERYETWAHRQLTYMFAVMALPRSLNLHPADAAAQAAMRTYATNLRVDFAGQLLPPIDASSPGADRMEAAYRTAKASGVGLSEWKRNDNALTPVCHVDECPDLFGLYYGPWTPA